MLWSWWGFLVLFFSSLIVWTCYLLMLNRVLYNIITFLLTIKLHITNLAGWNLCDYKMSKMTSDRFSVTFDAVFFFCIYSMWKDVKDSHSLMIIVTAPDSYSIKTVAVLIPAEQEGCSSLFHPHAPSRFFLFFKIYTLASVTTGRSPVAVYILEWRETGVLILNWASILCINGASEMDS